jgi:hypothetical protein
MMTYLVLATLPAQHPNTYGAREWRRSQLRLPPYIMKRLEMRIVVSAVPAD